MTELEACLWVILGCPVFIIIMICLWKLGNMGGPSFFEETDAARKWYREAASNTERALAAGVMLAAFFSGGYKILLTFLSGVVLVAISAVCQPSPLEIIRDILKEVRVLLLDLHSVIQRGDAATSTFHSAAGSE